VSVTNFGLSVKLRLCGTADAVCRAVVGGIKTGAGCT